MVCNSEFFLKLKSLFEKKLPFVSYKLPDSDILELHFSTKKIIRKFFLNESGFVIMPFENKKGYIIPKGKTLKTEITTQKKKALLKNSLPIPNKMLNHKTAYIKQVEDAIVQISKTEMEKVVCSQSFEFKANEINYLKYFKKLLNLYPDAFNYLFYHPNEGFWIGASPETLLNLDNNKLMTMALAGTKKRNVVKWRKKEIFEQKIVENYIKKNLNAFCSGLEISKRKTVLAGKIEHLKTVLCGTTKHSPFELINAIHPTPAVGGMPKELALSFIKKNEPHDRFFYSGYLGTVNNNNCNLYVNLRCANIKGSVAKIFVGGGITKDSVPEDEWEEIVLKSNTILNVLSV